jgi:hypothetical protein
MVKYRMHMTVQIGSLINFGQKIPQFKFILKIILFSVWVPNSEERKSNHRKSYLVKYRMHMTVQIGSLINFGQKIPQFRFILKIILFSVWVPNSEERKSNPRKPYLGVLVRIAESLYSGGRTPASWSASAYIGWIRVDYITYFNLN